MAQEQTVESLATGSARLPAFHANDPHLWFIQIEAQFAAELYTQTARKTNSSPCCTTPPIGDQKPSLALNRLRYIAGKDTPLAIVKTIWIKRLPTSIQQNLMTAGESDINKLAALADRLIALERPSVAALQHLHRSQHSQGPGRQPYEGTSPAHLKPTTRIFSRSFLLASPRSFDRQTTRKRAYTGVPPPTRPHAALYQLLLPPAFRR
ncbi:hypothetical protein GE061_017159 [Apolygus lucorum]|uniref:Uncharacterized protein n=1 Tax=Apolygus lucorum TaxID=248454 RepID=A0A8S9XKA3_APOLU|nr:hypothetical protein GE061_017159 [Apolygus lucorum]